MRDKRTRAITVTAIISTIATILMFIELAIPLFPEFLKLDLSDFPPLIASFAFGPIYGIAAELLKNLVHILFTKTAGVGEFANFIIGCALVIPAGFYYKRCKNRKGAVIGMILGTISMGIVGGIVNYYILIPFYQNAMGLPLDTIVAMSSKVFTFIDSLSDVVVYGIIPFNLFKGIIISAVTFVVYKRISPILHGLNNEK